MESDEVFYDIEEGANKIKSELAIRLIEPDNNPPADQGRGSESKRGSLLVPTMTLRAASPIASDEEEDHMRNTQRMRSKKVSIIK